MSLQMGEGLDRIESVETLIERDVALFRMVVRH